MWSRHWKTADPQLNLRPERLFFKCGNRKKSHGARSEPGFITSYQFIEKPWVAISTHLEERGWIIYNIICYPIPLLLGHQNMGDQSRTNFAVAEAVTQYAGCTPRWNVQDAGNFLQQNACDFVDHGLHTCNQLFVALFVIFYLALTVENAWFPRLKMFHPPETVALEGADDGLADRSSDNFCRGLSKKDAHLYVGPKIDGRESKVFHHFVRQCLLVLHGSQEMLWNKHSCSFPCELLHTNRSDSALFNDLICSFVRQVLQWI